MLHPACAQIAQQLRCMIWSKGPASLEFHNKDIFYKQIRIIVAQRHAVFIPDQQRKLLLNSQAGLPQPMSKSILVHFLQMSMP